VVNFAQKVRWLKKYSSFYCRRNDIPPKSFLGTREGQTLIVLDFCGIIVLSSLEAELTFLHTTKKPTKDHEWRIIRIKGSPAAYVGHVRAVDEKEAIRKAIQEFQITNSGDRKRLAAQRVD
jgi:hypothetical protein